MNVDWADSSIVLAMANRPDTTQSRLTRLTAEKLTQYSEMRGNYETNFVRLMMINDEWENLSARILCAQVQGRREEANLLAWMQITLTRLHNSVVRNLLTYRMDLQELELYFITRGITSWEPDRLDWDNDMRYAVNLVERPVAGQ